MLGGRTVCGAAVKWQQDYEQYCAGCHGLKGKGNGVAGYTLSGTNPTDLTQISRRNGGKFPFDEVYAIVDGTKEFPSHERLNMPFFGTNLESEGTITPSKGQSRIADNGDRPLRRVTPAKITRCSS